MSSEVKIDEQQIREYAHQIWLTEGCPQGQAQRHWDMARQLVEAEALAASAAPASARPPSMRQPRSMATSAKASVLKQPRSTGKADT
ncbi:DUF2934 domain-containing protein [Pseudomonas sp. SA3-5]|uniref:DUF2934 domain-containing protein n=1 Tax=Pseudomonas aestuarii TaxID=3018340 RepID=A0ABT4XI56_9PSED|nr:DUF2934 domain-containing protein [Pseudomonas aestuarii]MDA7087875.1 DUF2934 domain-containing protein [Pseudomonas aestuarii]